MTEFRAEAVINDATYDLGSQTISKTAIRIATFGPYLGGSGPNHFDMKDLTIGTTGYGSTDLFDPPLAGVGDFTGAVGSGADATFSGGVMSFNNTGDRFYYVDFGVEIPSIYVNWQMIVYADNNDPDYHDIGDVEGDPTALFTGIYDDTTPEWDVDGAPNNTEFGTGPIKDGATWNTIGFHWYFFLSTLVVFDGSKLYQAAE